MHVNEISVRINAVQTASHNQALNNTHILGTQLRQMIDLSLIGQSD